MEIQGKIKVIGEVKEVGSNGFKKRELVVVTEEQYPQQLMIEFVQDKCTLLDNYKPDDNVKVSINLRGREWTSPQGETKYFNSIHGWRIETISNEAPSSMPPPPQAADAFDTTDKDSKSDEQAEDDLPF